MKVTISALAVMLVMAIAVTVVSFSLAGNDNKGELVDEATFVAATNVDTNTNIDNIIENSYMTGEGADPVYKIVEIGSGSPSSLKTLVESGGFESFVINGNTTLDTITITDEAGVESIVAAIMNAECITYEFYKASDVTDDNATALAAISNADFIYVSNDASSEYSQSNDLGEELYNILHTYAVGDYKPLIIDNIADSTGTGGGGGGGTTDAYTMSGLASNVFDRSGKYYYTFSWDYPTVSAENFLNHVGSSYLGINGDKKSGNWTKVTDSANITDGVLADGATKSNMAEILVIKNGQTVNMYGQITPEATYANPLTNLVDLSGNAIEGDVYDIKDADPSDDNTNDPTLLYESAYNARYSRPDYVRVTQVDFTTDMAELEAMSFDKYDLIIIEPECTGTISSDLYKKFAAAMYGSINMIYPASLSGGTTSDDDDSESSGGNASVQQETNYSELFYMVATNDGQERYENIMVTDKTEFDIIASSNSSATCKVIADLINASAFRGNGGPKSSANKFTVLEIQPCYPIDTELANAQGDYYTIPSDVIDGQTKEALDEGTEYYAWELSKAKIAEAYNLSVDQITLVQMSTEQLAATKDDILGNYDLVYIGGNTTALKTAADYASYATTLSSTTIGSVMKDHIDDLKKLPIYAMYSHSGEMVVTDLSALAQASGTVTGSVPSSYVNINGTYKQSFSLLNGNDITYTNLTKLEEYVDAGMPIVFSSEATAGYRAAKDAGYLQNSVDPDCNMYKFMYYCGQQETAKNIKWGFDETQLDEVDNNGGDYGQTKTGYVKVFAETQSEELQTLYLDSAKRPKITLTQSPSIYNMYDDNSIIKNKQLNFKYKISGSTSYTVSLYVDDDGNSVFADDEIVATGGADSLEFTASDSFYGPVYWKLVVTDKSGQEASTTGISYIANSTTSKQKVRILQIMPGTYTSAGVRNAAAGETAQGKNSLYFCTICQQAYERLEYNPSSESGGRTSYVALYDGRMIDHVGGLSYQGNAGKIYLGLHEHEFGIVKYDSSMTISDRDFVGADDWDQNLADEVRDKYDFDIEIMMRSEFVAMSDAVAEAYDFSDMSDADKASATATNPYAEGSDDYAAYEAADVDGKLAMIYADKYEEEMASAYKDYTSLTSLIYYDEDDFNTAFADYQYIDELKLELNTLTGDQKVTAGFEKSTIDAEIELRTALMHMRDELGAGTFLGSEIARLLTTRHYWDYYSIDNGRYTNAEGNYTTTQGENINTLYQAYIALKDAEILANEDYKTYSRYLSGSDWMLDSYDMVVIGASDDFAGDDIIQTDEVDTVVTSNLSVSITTDKQGGSADVTISPNARQVTMNVTSGQYYGNSASTPTVVSSGSGKGEIEISGKFYAYDGTTVAGGKVTASYTANGTTMTVSAISDADGNYSMTLPNYTTATEIIYGSDGKPAPATNALADLEDYIANDGQILMFHDTLTRFEDAGSVYLTNMIKKYAAMDRYQMEIDTTKTDNLAASYYVPYISADPDKYFMTDQSVAGSTSTGSAKYTNWLTEVNKTINSWHSMKALYLTDVAYTDTSAVIQNTGGTHDGQMPYIYAEHTWAIAAIYARDDQTYISGKQSGNYGSDKASQVNQGIVTLYPFTLSDQLNVSFTHAQAYALDLENEDVTVWYAMGGGTGNKEGSSTYAASPYDGMDSYFIYTYENFNYCGAGHCNVTGVYKDNNDERRLYINIICNSVKKSIAQPDIFVYDYDTTENNIIKKSADMYVTKVNTTEEYPEFSFLVRLDEEASIAKVRIYYDLDYLTTELDAYKADDYHKLIVEWSGDNVTKGNLKNVFRYDTTLEMLLDADGNQIPETYSLDGTEYSTYATMLKLQPSYFDPYNGQYTYIVIEVTDDQGNISYKRIKIQVKDKLFNLT